MVGCLVLVMGSLLMTKNESNLRKQCSVVLHHSFDGNTNYSQDSILQCIDEWIQKGNVNTNGIVKYFQAYYS